MFKLLMAISLVIISTNLYANDPIRVDPIGTRYYSCPDYIDGGALGAPSPDLIDMFPALSEFRVNVPQGWTYYRSHMNRNMPYVIKAHYVVPQMKSLVCIYGIEVKRYSPENGSSYTGNYSMHEIKRPYSSNQVCAAVDNFRFRCVRQMIIRPPRGR